MENVSTRPIADQIETYSVGSAVWVLIYTQEVRDEK